MTRSTLTRRLGLFALLTLFVAAACSGDDPTGTPTTPRDPDPDPDPGSFTLSVTPSSVEILPGESHELAVTVTRTGAFSGAVSVSAEGLPGGVSASSTAIAGGATSGALTLTAADDAAAAQTQLTVRASSSVSEVADQTRAIALTVVALNPVPVLTQVVPDETVAGGPDLALSVVGEGFTSGAEVHWNGEARPTFVVSETELTAEIPATDLADPDTVQVTVVNPAPGGGTSDAVAFVVQPPPSPVAWVGSTTQTVSWTSPADGSAHELTVTATGLRFERVDTDDALPEGALRYGLVAGDVSVAFQKDQTFGCGAAVVGPVEGELHTGVLDVVTRTEANDSTWTRYRGSGTMEPVPLEVSMNCGTGGMVVFEITALDDWLATMDGADVGAWEEAVSPEALEGSHSIQQTFEGEAATWTWSWRFTQVEVAPDG